MKVLFCKLRLDENDRLKSILHTVIRVIYKVMVTAFSKWFVAKIWARLQAYLEVNPNTPAYDTQLKTEHNKLMYEWSSDNNMALITGHTHQPVFESLTLLERLYDTGLQNAKKSRTMKRLVSEIESHITHQLLQRAKRCPILPAFKPNYFNSGCCCFSDGDITGIEIENGCIRLIKWQYDAAENAQRVSAGGIGNYKAGRMK